MTQQPTYRQKAQGQALPLALVFISVLAGTFFFMFNSGQVTQEKMQITNTADAVAYSAGTFEARILNYDAYSNRAIIANEMAIGQAVGLAGWAKYAAISAGNISPYVRFIPYVGNALANQLNSFKQYVNSYYLKYVAEGVIPVHDQAIRALLAAQKVMHGGANSVAIANRMAVMQKVAAENDADVRVDALPITDDFLNFTQQYSSRNARKRMGNVVHASREGFLKSRNWQFGVFGCVTFGLKKRGSTELVNNVDGWKSMDTLSYWYWAPKWNKPCRKKERPVGYGTAFSKNGLNDAAYSYSGSRGTNPRASAMADGPGRAQYFAPNTTYYGAIPEYFELSSDALAQRDPKTTIAIRVMKNKDKQRFSGGAGAVKPAGALKLYEGGLVNNMTAASAKAEVYFERPDGANTVANGGAKMEIGSLFNPYWQARLVPLSDAERRLAQLRQGVVTP